MDSASQIVHAIHGGIAHVDCADREGFRCWVCGGASTRGADRVRWMGSNFTGQAQARCPLSPWVCEACVTVMAGRPPDTERMWSHLVEGDTHVRVNKGSKPAILTFLRRDHDAPWFAAIADTGQKHILPWTPVNAAGATGRVMFEEALVDLPRSAEGWDMLDAIAEALTSGATKEEIGTGAYGARAWQLLGASRLRELEAWLSRHRGGPWFDLAVWLAQRDESKVAARMAAEKEAKRGRGSQGKAARPDRRVRARAAKRVPEDAGVQRAEALGSDPGPDAVGGEVERVSGGVAHHDDADVAAGSAAIEQLALFS